MISDQDVATLPLTARDIPAVAVLLQDRAFSALLEEFPSAAVTAALRLELNRIRGDALRQELRREDTVPETLAAAVERCLRSERQPYYQDVINATGVVLHTALGRARLACSVAEELYRTSTRAQRVEMHLDTGRRGGRDAGCAQLLRRLTGAEDATVVNNNAAATLLAVSALGKGREAVVSHGELVEIGGSYRVPDVIELGGVVLHSVGTTNRTHLADYERAISASTGLLLKVHTSNFRVCGFTHDVSIGELSQLATARGVPLVHDLGSGALLDAAPSWFDEPLVADSIRAGADLVCFSGDKLLGGPQSGLILGRSSYVEQCRRHQLYRALRPGRLVYTALEATLRLYADGPKRAAHEIPTLRQLFDTDPVLKKRASRLIRSLKRSSTLACAVVRCESEAGSGSLPTVALPSWGAHVLFQGIAPDDALGRLRRGTPPVIARSLESGVLFDVRTLCDDEVEVVARRVREIAEVAVPDGPPAMKSPDVSLIVTNRR
jgi:L-seryl-tRNA(Ser) seleniumtransferase